jgi:lambda family phage portal protein
MSGELEVVSRGRGSSEAMSILRRARAREKAQAKGFRQYAAAQYNRLTRDWNAWQLSADAEIFNAIKIVRNRGRSLERDNDYVRRFLSSLCNNVLGHNGIGLQMRVKKGSAGVPDIRVNQMIEDAWMEWCKPENCTTSGSLSWCDVQNLLMRATARDGAPLIRKVKGFGNKFGFSLQLIEIDCLDLDYSVANVGNGNQVRMGVELDKWGKPVAYYILTQNPGDTFFMQAVTKYRERVPAEEIIHPFIRERIGQTREISWLTAAMMKLKMLDAYEEAEVVAARVGACKMGFFTQEDPESGYVGEEQENGSIAMEASPGVLEQLPKGVKLESWDPDHPNQNYGSFVKSVLRGIASGLGVSYNMLASDLEGVNYSSIRAGLLEEREQWKAIQRWFIESICEPIFREWMEMSVVSGALKLPLSQINDYCCPEWKPRRWSWVDPKNDVEAIILAIENGLSTRTKSVSETGGDFGDMLEEVKLENAEMEERGLAPSSGAAQFAVKVQKGSKETALFEKIGTTGLQGMIQIIMAYGKGEIPMDSARASLVSLFGISEEEAAKIIPEKEEIEMEEPDDGTVDLMDSVASESTKMNGHSEKKVSRVDL